MAGLGIGAAGTAYVASGELKAETYEKSLLRSKEKTEYLYDAVRSFRDIEESLQGISDECIAALKPFLPKSDEPYLADDEVIKSAALEGCGDAEEAVGIVHLYWEANNNSIMVEGAISNEYYATKDYFIAKALHRIAVPLGLCAGILSGLYILGLKDRKEHRKELDKLWYNALQYE